MIKRGACYNSWSFNAHARGFVFWVWRGGNGNVKDKEQYVAGYNYKATHMMSLIFPKYGNLENPAPKYENGGHDMLNNKANENDSLIVESGDVVALYSSLE